MFQNLGANEYIIIGLVILVLFGGKKIPELMRGIGESVREFRKAMAEPEPQPESEKKKSE